MWIHQRPKWMNAIYVNEVWSNTGTQAWMVQFGWEWSGGVARRALTQLHVAKMKIEVSFGLSRRNWNGMFEAASGNTTPPNRKLYYGIHIRTADANSLTIRLMAHTISDAQCGRKRTKHTHRHTHRRTKTEKERWFILFNFFFLLLPSFLCFCIRFRSLFHSFLVIKFTQFT